MTALATVSAATAFAAPAAAAAPDLTTTVAQVIAQRTGQAEGHQVTPQRRVKDWVFGIAMQRAEFKADAYPQAWLFLARRDGAEWTVAFDDSAEFSTLAANAPESVFNRTEKQTFAARDVSIQALSGNTGLRLPYAVGATWTMIGGTHGWAGSDTPYSSLDLGGGDGIVRAGGAGTVYTLCTDSSNGAAGGWRRVYHASGYTTDYYHLRALTSLADGSSIAVGTALGNTGRNICAGGSAASNHVHWGILQNTTRVGWHWRSAGQWVFWNAASAYNGYALHGSLRRDPGQGLYNYGALGANQGIVDANGGGTVNKRSGPGTGFPVVGSVADGTVVTISCWRNGTSHTGRFGATAVWDKLSDGTWISDAFAYTGVTTIGPNC